MEWNTFHQRRKDIAIQLLKDVAAGTAHATGAKMVTMFGDDVKYVAENGCFQSKGGLFGIIANIRRFAFSDVRENERFNNNIDKTLPNDLRILK